MKKTIENTTLRIDATEESKPRGAGDITLKYIKPSPERGPTLLREWSNVDKNFISERSVYFASSFQLRPPGEEGTLEWFKAIVFSEVQAPIPPKEAQELMDELRTIIDAHDCLQDEKDVLILGCTAHTTKGFVLAENEARTVDCSGAIPTFDILVPKYEVVPSNDYMLHPQEMWICKEKFDFKGDDANTQLLKLAEHTSNQATATARVAVEHGTKKPLPFKHVRTMDTSAFPVLVRDEVLGRTAEDQYVRFGASVGLTGTKIEILVYGDKAAEVDYLFHIVWNKPSSAGEAPAEAQDVLVYKTGEQPTSVSNVTFSVQPDGIFNDIVTALSFS